MGSLYILNEANLRGVNRRGADLSESSQCQFERKFEQRKVQRIHCLARWL